MISVIFFGLLVWGCWTIVRYCDCASEAEEENFQDDMKKWRAKQAREGHQTCLWPPDPPPALPQRRDAMGFIDNVLDGLDGRDQDRTWRSYL